MLIVEKCVVGFEVVILGFDKSGYIVNMSGMIVINEGW